jgi:raffinose/stachyose/melibiose transport system permease protein
VTRRWHPRRVLVGTLVLAVVAIFFVIPFLFMLLMATKDRSQASRFGFDLPEEFLLWENIQEVFDTRDGLIITAFQNSIVLTVLSVTGIVLVGTMAAFVLQRRRDRVGGLIAGMLLLGLILPPALVPTIYVLQWIGLFKTLFGLVLVEVALILPFAVLIFRTFMTAIPRELDEAAIIDGATPWKLFSRIHFPLLRPAVITVIVVASVTVYNDFVNPLYFLPGDDNVTVQLTLFNFQSQFSTRWNLLFADVLLITIPPMIMFIFFQRQIVSGMTAGAVKG